MTSYFKQQLADYVEYHRDPRNCAMHVLGIVVLFLGAILPLTMYSIPVFGLQIGLGTLLVAPVLIYWLMLDMTLGLAIVVAAAVLILTATLIVDHTGIVAVWMTTATLIAIGVASQIIGHRVFEQRQPAMADNPTHFLLGPMFVMAKLFIVLGARPDLAAILAPAGPRASVDHSVYLHDRPSEPHAHS